MSFCRSVPVRLALGLLSMGVLVSPALAQIQALPPYNADMGLSSSYAPLSTATPTGVRPVSETRMQQLAQRGERAVREYQWASQAAAALGQSHGSPTQSAGYINTAIGPVSAPQNLPPIDQVQHVTPLMDTDLQSPQSAVTDSLSGVPTSYECCPTWQILPDGLMYKSYLANGRESRFASIWFYEKDYGWLWDSALGGRVGILRHGTPGHVNPQGWQVDIEGAAFPRLDMENGRDMVSADFRFGIPLTGRRGRWQTKFGYYHLSSHLGDEYMVMHHTLQRINYARDCLVLGFGYDLHPDLRLYAETAWAFYANGGSKPWEFQFGVDYIPARPSGFFGAPFFAINGRIREEVDFGGNFTLQTGWQWRGVSGHVFRLGMHYFNGMSDQYQFFDQFEEQLGVAVWYDY